MNARLILGAICLALLAYGRVAAQQAVIEGYVFNERDKEPLTYADVTVQEHGYAARTDSTGYFRLVLPPGLYNVQAAYTGFGALSKHEIMAISAKPVFLEFFLEESRTELQAVEVLAEAFRRTAESPVSAHGFSVHEMERMPGAVLDISRFMKTLPGVSPQVSFGYNLIVRGGAAQENKFYLDDIEIPAINHFSVQGATGGPNGLINSRMLQGATLHTGAFPAARPNALSSVLDIQQREGRKDRFGGNFTLGVTDFGFQVEGPMGSKSSYLLSARESYSQHMFKAIGIPVLPFYADAQYKQVIRFNPKHELTLVGLGAYDKYTLNLGAKPTESLLYNTGYIPQGRQYLYTLGARYKYYGRQSVTRMVLSRNYFYNYAEKFRDNVEEESGRLLKYASAEAETKFRLERREYRTKSNWEYGLSLEHSHHTTDNYSLYTGRDAVIDTLQYSGVLGFVRYGGFISYEQQLLSGAMNLFAGLRADGNSYASQMQNPLDQLSPRLAVSWQFLPGWKASMSAGLYHQVPSYVLLNYREDGIAVNRDRLRYISSTQSVLGIEHMNALGYKVSLEGFYKYYDRYPYLLADGISYANANANYVVIGNQPALAGSTGQAYGLEFQARQKLRANWFWMVSYSYVVSRFAGPDGKLHSSSWDNRHFGTVSATRTFGKGWQIGLRWSMAGGSPYTPYDIALSSRTDVWDANRRGLFDYTRINTEHLPFYHQMDLRVDKTFNFRKWTMTVFADVQNLYRSPIAQIPYLTVQRDDQLQPLIDPAMPGHYLTQILPSDTGRILPGIGVIIDF